MLRRVLLAVSYASTRYLYLLETSTFGLFSILKPRETERRPRCGWLTLTGPNIWTEIQ